MIDNNIINKLAKAEEEFELPVALVSPPEAIHGTVIIRDSNGFCVMDTMSSDITSFDQMVADAINNAPKMAKEIINLRKEIEILKNKPVISTGVKCDACGNIVSQIMFRPLDGRGRCASCIDAGVSYGAYLRKNTPGSEVWAAEETKQVAIEEGLYACIACNKFISATGMCSGCSNAWRIGRDETEQPYRRALALLGYSIPNGTELELPRDTTDLIEACMREYPTTNGK